MFRKYVLLVCSALVFCLCAFSLRVAGEQRALAARLIRLHVVAASDEPADQVRKLRVRDALLPRIAALTANCQDADAAARALARALPGLEALAAGTLKGGESVRAGLAWEPFPRRDYVSFSLPAGSYRALRVVLGAGQGHNWWCVAFPALCLPAEPEASDLEDAACAAGLSAEQISLMDPEAETTRIKFRVLDWLAELFGG